jgi:hypothetical protein
MWPVMKKEKEMVKLAGSKRLLTEDSSRNWKSKTQKSLDSNKSISE